MDISKIPAGRNPPHERNAVIEIPALMRAALRRPRP